MRLDVASLIETLDHDERTPGQSMGAEADDAQFVGRFTALKEQLDEQLAQGEEMGALTQAKLEGVVFDG